MYLQGTIGFESQIDKCLELSEYLYNKIKDREGYEMVFDGKVRTDSNANRRHNITHNMRGVGYWLHPFRACYLISILPAKGFSII